MKTQVGKVSLEYTREGALKSSLFEPTMAVSLDPDLEQELKKIECPEDPETLEHNASLVLASFFSKMTHIELRDVASTTLKGEIESVERYPGNKIKKVVLAYVFDDGKEE